MCELVPVLLLVTGLAFTSDFVLILISQGRKYV